MPARLLKHKPNVACPEDKVQVAKDLGGKKRSSSPAANGLTAQLNVMDPAWSQEKAKLLPTPPSQGQEEIASSCARGGLDWLLEKKSLL